MVKKIIRNSPCPCGSGKKFKHCCERKPKPIPIERLDPAVAAHVRQKMAEHKAAEAQRTAQQGLGRPVISTDFKGHKVVAVGNTVMFSKNWKTFHDFLFHYIKKTLGAEWGNAEIAKALDHRHHIMQWYDATCRLQQANFIQPGVVTSGPMTGAVSAYLRIAYDLYCIAHNAKLHTSLVARLKDPVQFRGAHYEVYVAATFMRAGFTVDFEDEADRRKTHCEFVATHKTGRKYSVEAKRRHHQADKVLSRLRVGDQLVRALRKEAAHARIIFVDMNIATPMEPAAAEARLRDAALQVSKFERQPHIKKKLFDPAFVVITNHPIPADVDGPPPPTSAIASSYRIPDFGVAATFNGLRAAHHARLRHKDMHDLFESMEVHGNVPSTFDGENPELAFRDEQPARLVIGRSYEVPLEDGTAAQGVLREAVMVEKEKHVMGIYSVPDGRQVMVRVPVTDAEVAAYRRHPDTFFGVEKRAGKGLRDVMDVFYFLLEAHSKSDKAMLLRHMAQHPDIEQLRALSQPEIAEIYCERMAWNMWNQMNRAA